MAEGEVLAAKEGLARARAEYDYAGTLTGRIGQEGDDVAEVHAENIGCEYRYTQAAIGVLLAEGALACAKRRHKRLLQLRQEERDAADDRGGPSSDTRDREGR